MRTDAALAKWIERGIANVSAMKASKPARKAAAKKDPAMRVTKSSRR
jgi:hypothetical protein